MIARAFDDDRAAAIAHRKALACRTRDIAEAAPRTVEARGAVGGFARRAGATHDDRAALHTLADVVVSVAVEFQPETAGEKRTETLPRGTDVAAPLIADRFTRVPLRDDVVGEPCADGTIGGADWYETHVHREIIEMRFALVGRID